MIRHISDLFDRLTFRRHPKTFPQWSGQSIEEILAMQSDDSCNLLYIVLVEALYFKESRGVRLTESELTVLSINALEGQVNNGGFLQYFQNRSNEYVERVEQDLISIRCKNTAEIVAAAIGCLELTDLSPEAIEHRLDAVDESVFIRLEKLDDAFIAYPDDIATKLFEFVDANNAQFQLLPIDGWRGKARKPLAFPPNPA